LVRAAGENGVQVRQGRSLGARGRNLEVKKQGRRQWRGRGGWLPVSRVGVLQEGVEGREGDKKGSKTQRERARDWGLWLPSWIAWQQQNLN